MRPMQLDGETDLEDRVKVINYLHEKHKIPLNQIQNNGWILFDREDFSIMGTPMEPPLKLLLASHIHHPDIIVRDANHNIRFLVEIDGSVHHSRPGMKQTERRNSHYREAGLKCIVLDIADLKVLGQPWQAYLDDHMNK